MQVLEQKDHVLDKLSIGKYFLDINDSKKKCNLQINIYGL